MITLDTAISIAVRAHYDRKDLAGEPYILHLLRVMLQQTTLDGRVAGVLHDILEDTAFTADDLRAARCTAETVRAVVDLTRLPGEDYLRVYIERVARNPLAKQIKISDLRDNMDPARLKVMTGRDIDRVENRYRPALRRLLEAAPPLVQITGLTGRIRRPNPQNIPIPAAPGRKIRTAFEGK